MEKAEVKVKDGEDSNVLKEASQTGFTTCDQEEDKSESQDGGTVRMKRQIGLFGGISMIAGNMIGSGIFVTPTGLLKRTDSVATSLVIWAACGLLSILTAISYIELGSLVPRSGGEHAYFMEAYKPMHSFWGEVPAFLFAWMTIMFLKPASIGVLALGFGQYTVEPITKAMGVGDDWKESKDHDWAVRLLAIVIVWLMAFINIASAKVATKIQIVFTFGKIFCMLILIGIGIYNVAMGKYGGIPTEYDKGNGSYGDIAMAFYSGLFTYDGWNNLNYLMEELVNPKRNLPLGIFIGIGMTTVLYMLINVAYLTVHDKASMIASTAVAVDVGDSVLGPLKFIIPLFVVLSTVGSCNGGLFTSGRVGYVASRDGHLPHVVSFVHATLLTPSVSIIWTTLLAMLMIAASETVNQLINFFSFVSWIFYGLALTCVVIFRFTKPDVPRQIKVPIVIPVFAILISIFLVAAPIIDQPSIEYFYVLGFALIGMIFYYFFVFKKTSFSYGDKITEKIQCLAVVVPSPYKED